MSVPDEILEKLEVGEQVVIPGRGGWEMVVKRCEDGFDFTHRNPVEEGKYKLFVYNTSGNPYGAGMIVQEPTLGVACRNCGVDVDGAIIGALVLGEDGKIRERFSWSNLVFMKKGEFSISGEGELKVNGEAKGCLRAIFLADKNRIKGYVGIFGPAKPEKVKVLEMEDLLLASV
jgi:hypothetical protein